MNSITEIVNFRILENIAKEEFIQIVDDLEKQFHSIQPGFIDTELLYDEKNEEWIMIQHWDCIENCRSSSRKMFKTSLTEKFRNVLKERTVNMRMTLQIKRWKR